MQTLASLTASVIGRGLRIIPLAPAVMCIVWATGGGCYAWAEDLVLTARSLQAAGQHMEAVTLLSSALKSAEQLKLTAGDRTVIFAEMGGLYLELGRYIEAERHLRRSLAIFDRELLAPSPVRLQAVNDLVSVYIETRDYSRAQKLLERTFSQEGQLLDLHPLQRARALENLATVYYFRKRYNEAGVLLQVAVRLRDQRPDADSAGKMVALTTLASVLLQTAPEQALPPIERARRIGETTFGQGHPALARVLITEAGVYRSIRRTTEAETSIQEALAILGKGEYKPLLQTALEEYALLLRQTGRSREAKANEKRARGIREELEQNSAAKHEVDVSSFQMCDR